MTCKDCSLYTDGHPFYVPGNGPGFPCRFMLIGEAPGADEVLEGIPFVGDSGVENDALLRWCSGIPRPCWYVTNIIKCRPPLNRDPTENEIACCSRLLMEEIKACSPEIIVTVGRFAMRRFLGDDAKMQYVHGIPYYTEQLPHSIIIPCYHPASILHTTGEETNVSQMTLVSGDYKTIGKVLRKEVTPRIWGGSKTTDSFASISLRDHCDVITALTTRGTGIAIDTESMSNGDPLCLTFSKETGIGYKIDADRPELLKTVAGYVGRKDVTVILHNALWDLKVLAQMGVVPSRYEDTMIMAYLLQDRPQGLKPLSYRLLDIVLDNYQNVAGPAQAGLSRAYLKDVVSMDWPDPEPELVIDSTGILKEKKPQNIKKKVGRALKAYAKDNNIDLFGRWHKMTGTKIVEDSFLGPMPKADLSHVDSEIATVYAVSDAITTLMIYPKLKEEIHSRGLETVYSRDIDIIRMVLDMMAVGFPVNMDYFHHLSEKLSLSIADLECRIHQMYRISTGLKNTVNLGSSPQLASMLYKMGIFHKRGMSTGVESLDRVRDRHPVVNMISEWKHLNKIKSTYTDRLPEKAVNGRVHTKLSTTRVVTGRLASSEPNLHNQPARSETGRSVKRGFVADPGCVLLASDYSQIEMRVLAHVSQDYMMLARFLDGEDIHSLTAAEMFRIPVESVDAKKHRYPAKRVGFGIVYGLSAVGLQKQMLSEGLIYTIDECQSWIDSWLQVYAGVDTWLSRTKAYARCTGFVKDLFGRKRLIPEVASVHKKVREAGLRQAVNAPIQMGAQGIIKQAMVDLTPVYNKWRKWGYRMDPLIQIHDELIFQVQSDILIEVADNIKQVMENTVPLSLPTPVDQKVGETWGDMEGLTN